MGYCCPFVFESFMGANTFQGETVVYGGIPLPSLAQIHTNVWHMLVVAVPFCLSSQTFSQDDNNGLMNVLQESKIIKNSKDFKELTLQCNLLSWFSINHYGRLTS